MKPQRRKEALEAVDELETLYRSIQERGDCLSLKKLAVNGQDLIADGMRPGKKLGEVLNALLADVLDEPSHNTKEYLLEQSRSLR